LLLDREVCSGYTQEANKLLETVQKLIEMSDFREYYYPFSGVGYGASEFTWSGLVVDMIRIRDLTKEEASRGRGSTL
jgi:hypothetical protein